MVKMIVFDMAGTTVNENNVVYKTLQKTINEAGFNFTLNQVLEQGAGKEKLQAIKSILNIFDDNNDSELADNIYQNFIVQLAIAYKDLKILPQDNAVELFAELKKRNIITILNTGYNRETAQLLLTKIGWQKGIEFDDLVTASDVKKNRPDADMILFAMDLFNIKNGNEVIKVGDSIIDIEEGKNTSCILTIGIITGAHTQQQLQSADPDYIIHNLLEIINLLDVVK